MPRGALAWAPSFIGLHQTLLTDDLPLLSPAPCERLLHSQLRPVALDLLNAKTP